MDLRRANPRKVIRLDKPAHALILSVVGKHRTVNVSGFHYPVTIEGEAYAIPS